MHKSQRKKQLKSSNGSLILMMIYIRQKHFIIILKYSDVFVCFRGYWIMLVSVAAQILEKCPHSANISPRGLRINYSAVKDIIVVLIARRYSPAETVSILCHFHDKRWRDKMETLVTLQAITVSCIAMISMKLVISFNKKVQIKIKIRLKFVHVKYIYIYIYSDVLVK